MVLDEDGRPVRGAGALPFVGGAGGVGDMSGVTFSRNIMEKPPSPNTQGTFMDKFSQMIADVAAGKAGEVLDTPTLTPKQPKNYDKAVRMKANREAAAQRMRDYHARKRAEKEAGLNGKSVEMSESHLSEPRKRQAVAGPAGVQGADQQHGVSPIRMSDVSRAGGDVNGSLPEIQQDLETADPSLQPFIANQQPFNINVQMFMDCPIQAAQELLDELRKQTEDLAKVIEQRRHDEQVDDESKCTWCKQPFTNGYPFARHPFEIGGVGSGQWRSIRSCRNKNCLDKQNEAYDRIDRDMRAERGL